MGVVSVIHDTGWQEDSRVCVCNSNLLPANDTRLLVFAKLLMFRCSGRGIMCRVKLDEPETGVFIGFAIANEIDAAHTAGCRTFGRLCIANEDLHGIRELLLVHCFGNTSYQEHAGHYAIIGRHVSIAVVWRPPGKLLRALLPSQVVSSGSGLPGILYLLILPVGLAFDKEATLLVYLNGASWPLRFIVRVFFSQEPCVSVDPSAVAVLPVTFS